MPVDLPVPSVRASSPDPLRADCSLCVGLCCVAPAFSASADFAIDKPAGQPCPNLGADFSCQIHADLGGRGFSGCTVYDCFGAGQHVAQQIHPGRDWRQDEETAGRIFAAFHVVRELHELLWYLREALGMGAASPLHGQLEAVQAETLRRRHEQPDTSRDLDEHWAAANRLLMSASELARAEVHRRGRDRRGADLIGRNLKRVRLRGADLRGAYLLGADLRGSDLTGTDLIGADLRAADVRDADLSAALFLTQPQLSAARGNAMTGLPPRLSRPLHWPR